MLPSHHDQFTNADIQTESNMIHVSHLAGAARNDIYTLRAPSPPHIHIPQAPDEYVLQTPSLSGMLCENEQHYKVLQETIARNSYFMPPQEWKYEWRRQAQQILPFLYLGPSAAARDIEFIKQENMTMLLVIRDTATAQAKLLDGAKIANKHGIESTVIDVNGQLGLINAFPRAAKAINDHITSMNRQSNGSIIGKVLVCCESGNERSAAVVCAYLMSTYGLDLISSIHRIQAQRFCISFDDNLKNLLLNYMEILTARKNVYCDVIQATIPAQSYKSRLKRRRNEVIEDERDMIAMDLCNDEERFKDRAYLAPFR